MNDEELAAFQAALLEILAEATGAEDALARMAARPECAPLRDWWSAADPRMLGVASALVKRWARSGPAPITDEIA